MRIREICEATTAPTASGNFAPLANPIQARQKLKRDKNGVPIAPQKKNPDGTVKSALDIKDNIIGTPLQRR